MRVARVRVTRIGRQRMVRLSRVVKVVYTVGGQYGKAG